MKSEVMVTPSLGVVWPLVCFFMIPVAPGCAVLADNLRLPLHEALSFVSIWSRPLVRNPLPLSSLPLRFLFLTFLSLRRVGLPSKVTGLSASLWWQFTWLSSAMVH